MKLKVYMRVARGGDGKPKVDARMKPNYRPLFSNPGSWREKALPTAAFALELDIPDEVFRRAETVLAEIALDDDDATIAANIA